MKETYTIAIVRPGMGDLPDLAQTDSSEVAAALVRTLLDCHDTRIATITVAIQRIVSKDVAI